MVSESTNRTCAVAVHYKSPETLAMTWNDLNRDFNPDHIFIVDNSDDLDESWDLRAQIIRPNENLGYARAVNEGIRLALVQHPNLLEVLVCTHETLFDSGVIQQLLDVAAQFPAGHIVAPMLSTKNEITGKLDVWSEGGRLSVPFKYPQHIRTGAGRGVTTALWVDGAAFVISVRSWQELGGIPEEFFLYMEDVALGFACRKRGIPVLVDLDVSVEQSANGPSRYLAIRNRIILARDYFSPFDRALVYAEIYARALIFGFGLGATAKDKAAESWQAIRDARDGTG